MAAAFFAHRPTRAHASVSSETVRDYPFLLGIASGDPLPDGVVLWTRLAPRPFEPFGGLDGHARPVQWQVATDPRFHRIVRDGTAYAHPEFAHSVHVDVRGLAPATEYFYRFRSGPHVSEVGRTKTAPRPGTAASSLDLVVASCQSWGGGFYHAWRDAAAQPADAVLFLGDYIYEYVVREGGVRPVPPGLPDDFERETDTLERFRLQYALYKTDPDLIEAHRVAPWIVTWDDHDVYNDYAGSYLPGVPEEEFLVRRANAYRAFWEHLPLRLAQRPAPDGATRLHRRLTFGDLAQFSVLDARQFRSRQVPGSTIPESPERRDPSRTMLGSDQEAWLVDGLPRSRTIWNVVAQSVLFGLLDIDPTSDRLFSAGGWDGYQASQQRIIDTVVERNVPNFVVLTGDVHRNYDLDLLANFDDPASRTIGVEFAGTSISSGGDGVDFNDSLQVRLDANPHLKFANLQRGYLRCQVDRQAWTTTLRVLDKVSTTAHSVSTRAVFRVEAGNPGLIRL